MREGSWRSQMWSLTPLGVGVQSTGRRARKPGMPVTRSPLGDPSIRSVQATINGVRLARQLLLGGGDAPGRLGGFTMIASVRRAVQPANRPVLTAWCSAGGAVGWVRTVPA